MSFEEDYQDVLMNIEMPVLALFGQHPELLDLHVDEGLGALASRYKAEEQGKEIYPPRVKGLALSVFEAVQISTELMLGRPQQVTETVSLDVLLACLARIRKSVRMWTKERGSRGYLTFIQEMMAS
jgi:hypothetical protein